MVDMMRGVEDQAHVLEISHATRFLGYRSEQELIDIFKAADVVCIPSRNEPFGVVVLEAWAAGKPVIASKNGGPDEFVWHEVNGFKVSDNPDSIAWGIGTLFADFERAREIGMNGRKTVEQAFSWESIADQMLEVYYS
jgi:Glycosyltransferase